MLSYRSNKKFQKTVEDFACQNCGREVVGSGYTNHCPHCLWSKHVDVYPGDRASECGGMMEPVGLENKKSEWSLIHKCLRCGHVKNNKASSQDDQDKIIELAKFVANK